MVPKEHEKWAFQQSPLNGLIVGGGSQPGDSPQLEALGRSEALGLWNSRLSHNVPDYFFNTFEEFND